MSLMVSISGIRLPGILGSLKEIKHGAHPEDHRRGETAKEVEQVVQRFRNDIEQIALKT